MDLMIKDVAELLNVSEIEIRRWLDEGKIPSYRIDQQYRFSRIEIEDWMIKRQKMEGDALSFSSQNKKESESAEKSQAAQTSGSSQFGLYRAIHKGGVLHKIPGQTKEAVIRKTMELVAEELDFDADVITDLLLDRESLQSTAVGNGIAIPHTRDFLSAQDAVAVAFPDDPIDYDALDGKPVHTLFFLFASDDKRHLHLLAKIAHLSSQHATLQFLKTKPNKELLLDYIKKWETSIQKIAK